MASIRLWFSSSPVVELHRTLFFDPVTGGADYGCVRGKLPGAFVDCGTFQWTPAVKAISILLLKAAASGPEKERSAPALIGGVGSPASSLDGALRKQPRWLREMFGCTKSGNARARRLFPRTNSDRRRPGPVSVNLRGTLLSPEDVTVIIDGDECVSRDRILELAENLEQDWVNAQHKLARRSTRKKDGFCYDSCSKKSPAQKLFELHATEVNSSLRNTDIFRPRVVSEMLKRIAADPSFSSVAGDACERILDLHSPRRSANWFGVVSDSNELRRQLTPDEPIRVAVPCTLPAGSVLFRYLRDIQGFNIELDSNFTHAVEIVRHLREGTFDNPPDLVVLGVAPAATVLSLPGSAGYSPFMLMPSLSQRVLSLKSKKRSQVDRGEYVFLESEPSSASFYFHDLERMGVISRGRVSVRNGEPHEVFAEIREGNPDLRAILFFPYHEINRVFNGCTFVDSMEEGVRNKAFLLASDSFSATKPRRLCLETALRNAWIELLRSPSTVDTLTRELCESSSYSRFLTRSSGLGLTPECTTLQ